MPLQPVGYEPAFVEQAYRPTISPALLLLLTGGGSAPFVARTFWAAVVRRVKRLVPGLSGGLWLALAEDEADGAEVQMPFGVYDRSAPGTILRNAAGEGLVDSTFTVAVYDTVQAVSYSLAVAVAAALKDAPLLFDDGVLVHLRPTGPVATTLDPDPGPGGAAVYQAIANFRYMVQRES